MRKSHYTLYIILCVPSPHLCGKEEVWLALQTASIPRTMSVIQGGVAYCTVLVRNVGNLLME